MLYRLSEMKGLSASDVVRQMIRELYEKTFGKDGPRGTKS